MKRLLRNYIIETFSLYLVANTFKGIFFTKGLETLFLTGLALFVVSFLAKPIINLLLLPINLVTFGVFRWLSAAVTLYLVTLLVPGFKISGFYFQGFKSAWFDIPVIDIKGILAFIAFSLAISLLTTTIHWLRK